MNAGSYSDALALSSAGILLTLAVAVFFALGVL